MRLVLCDDQKILVGQPVTINYDDERARDFSYVSDCVYTNYLVATVEHQSGFCDLRMPYIRK